MTVVRTRLQLYFAYGSNMDVAQMRSRVPGSRLMGSGYLRGYEFVFSGFSSTWGGAVANVKKKPRSKVFGVVYELPHGGLEALDRFEGYPTHYDRKLGTIVMRDSGVEFACHYYFKPRTKADAPPSPAYVQTILKALARHGAS